MTSTTTPQPTDRELEILQVLWDRGEASVREVYEELRERLPIVQNTVQAFLRMMEQKGLVKHRIFGRAFIYKPLVHRDATKRRLVKQLMQLAFNGAVDQLVRSALSVRRPTPEELDRVEEMLEDLKKGSPTRGNNSGSD